MTFMSKCDLCLELAIWLGWSTSYWAGLKSGHAKFGSIFLKSIE